MVTIVVPPVRTGQTPSEGNHADDHNLIRTALLALADAIGGGQDTGWRAFELDFGLSGQDPATLLLRRQGDRVTATFHGVIPEDFTDAFNFPEGFGPSIEAYDAGGAGSGQLLYVVPSTRVGTPNNNAVELVQVVVNVYPDPGSAQGPGVYSLTGTPPTVGYRVQNITLEWLTDDEFPAEPYPGSALP